MISIISKLNVTKIYPLAVSATRNYAFKSELKIKWIRPEKISCIDPRKSGDLKPMEPIQNKQLVLEFEDCKDLENVPESVRKLFTLDYNQRRLSIEVTKRDMIERVKRHEYDTFSMEARIAKMTAAIRGLQDIMDKFPRNKRIKVVLKEMIDKRKKLLKHLRRWDYKKFEWLLEKLDIVYKPPPSEFHWVTRRESLTKLTDKYCEDIKEKRLTEYKQLLKSQQKDFLKGKIESYEFIRKEQLECGVPATVSETQISEMKLQYRTLYEDTNETPTTK